MARPVGRRGETRERILETALELFAENGVHGTSLQQIADRLGVAKATVYHQFSTKEALIRAVVQPVADALGELLARAEACTDRGEQVEVVLSGMVDMVIGRRRLSSVMHGDPMVDALVGSVTEVGLRSGRLKELLLGPDPDPGRRAALSMFNGGLMLSGTDPAVAGLPDDVLRRELLAASRRLFSGER